MSFAKVDTENDVRLVITVMASGAHSHISCFDLVFRPSVFPLQQEPPLPNKDGGRREADPNRSRERLSRIFELQARALVNWENAEVCSRDPRRRDLFHSPVSKMAIQF